MADNPSALILTRVRLGAGGPLARVRVADGRITHVVPETDTGAGSGVEVGGGRQLDLDGRVLLPGLWDAHVHLAEWASARHRLDLAGTASARAVADLVRERAGVGDGTVLYGYGFRDGLWADAPHKALLDAVLPDRPVALVSADLHAAWLNSACLALVGRGDHPTGLIREHEAHEVLSALPAAPVDVVDGWIEEACRPPRRAESAVSSTSSSATRWGTGNGARPNSGPPYECRPRCIRVTWTPRSSAGCGRGRRRCGRRAGSGRAVEALHGRFAQHPYRPVPRPLPGT